MFTLRDYQTAAIPKIRAALAADRSTIIRLPTGGGKTVMGLSLAMEANRRGKSVLWLAHRKELIEQPARKLVSYGFSDFGCIKSGHPRDKELFRRHLFQLGSPQTIRQRIRKDPGFKKKWDFIVVDECDVDEYSTFLDELEYEYRIGLTATPFRTDGKGLRHWFRSIVEVTSTAELTGMGRLKPMEVWHWPDEYHPGRLPTGSNGDYLGSAAAKAMDIPILRGKAVDHWMQIARGLPTLVFCAGVEHAKNVAEEYQAHGVMADYVHGGMKPEERASKFAMFESGHMTVLCNVDIATAGYDFAGIQCIQALRPTKSLRLVIQALGRGVRPLNGEFCEPGERCVFLDHAGWTNAFGQITDPLRYSLDGVEKNTRETANHYECPSCHFILFSWPRTCPNCRAALPREEPAPREPTAVDETARLVKLGPGGVVRVEVPRVGAKERDVWATYSRVKKAEGQSAAKRLAAYHDMSGGIDPPADSLAKAGIKIVVSAGERRVCWASEFREMDIVQLTGFGMDPVPAGGKVAVR